MRLIWHLAKKDVRRMAVPVAVWIVLIVAPTIAFVAVSPPNQEPFASNLQAWREMLARWVDLFSIVPLLIGYTIAGALVLEDPLPGSTAFWTTRPIAGGRLLAAKLLAAALLLVAAPLLALLPIWLACGFGVRDAALAAAGFAARHASAALVAIALASLVRTLPQFLLCSIGIIGAFVATSVIPSPWRQAASVDMRLAREALVGLSVVPVVAAIAAHQFFTRRVVRSWILLAAGLLGAAVVRCAWPWPLPSLTMPPRLASLPEQAAASLQVPATFSRFTRYANERPILAGTTTWSADGFYVPVFARSSDRNLAMQPDGEWTTDAGLRALGLKKPGEPMPWRLLFTSPGFAGGSDPRLAGTLEIWWVGTRILGEVPLQARAEARNGGHLVRVLEVRWNDDRVDEILLEEREPYPSGYGRYGDHWNPWRAHRTRYFETYFLVNRATGKAQPLRAGREGTIEMNSIALRFPRLGAAWMRSDGEPVLIKLRFKRDRRFEHPFEVRGVVENAAAKP